MITTSGGGALICNSSKKFQEVSEVSEGGLEILKQVETLETAAEAANNIMWYKHVQALYEDLLKDVEGVTLHEQPADPRYDANFWLCAATLDPSVRIQGQENAYKEVIKTAVGGAAGVIKAVDSATTDCQPNDNVEALRVFMLAKKVECRPVWN